jgi:hypothetical protein
MGNGLWISLENHKAESHGAQGTSQICRTPECLGPWVSVHLNGRWVVVTVSYLVDAVCISERICHFPVRWAHIASG